MTAYKKEKPVYADIEGESNALILIKVRKAAVLGLILEIDHQNSIYRSKR